MNELVEYAQLLMNFLQQSGASLNADSQRALGSMLQNILQVIEQQSQVGLQPATPEIPRSDIPSSNVNGFAFDEDNDKLYVRFLGKYPNEQGPVYEYTNVPPMIFQLLRQGAVPARTDGQNRWGRWWKGKVPSLGASVHTLLKLGGFDYRRVA